VREKRRGILPELHIVDVLRKRASSPATADAEHTLHGLGHLEIRYVSGLAGLFRAPQAQGQTLIVDERSDEQEYAHRRIGLRTADDGRRTGATRTAKERHFRAHAR